MNTRSIVAGDTTFRTQEQNTIDVTTRHLFEDVSGMGSVRLHGQTRLHIYVEKAAGAAE